MSASKRAAKSQAQTAPGVGTAWLDHTPVFAFGNGNLLIGGKLVQPHKGAIVACCLAPNGSAILTAGDDGCVYTTDQNGQSVLVFARDGAWLDSLIPHSIERAFAIIIGRDVLLIELAMAGKVIATFKPARAPNSLSFNGDGTRLAIGHSGGVSLFETAKPSAPEYELPCPGGPVSVALDPTGSFLFAGLAEPALAGWRLRDGQGFRMGGYPGKPKQLFFHDDGKALLTSGGPALLVWPMVAKDGNTLSGPMGQAAGVYRPRLGLVSAVSSHGARGIVGWSDGGVDLVDLVAGTARHVSGPRPQTNLEEDPRALTAGIVAVSFRGDGKQVSWIGEQGAYGSAAVQ